MSIKLFFSSKRVALKVAWQMLIFIGVIFSVVEAPLHYALDIQVKESHLWWDSILSFLFITDIVLNLKGKLTIKEDEVTVPLNTFGYDKTPYKDSVYFKLDLLASIPFDLIGYAIGGNSWKLVRMMRLMRVLRVVKLMKLYKIASLLPKGFKLAGIGVAMYLCLHWIACGWMLMYPAEVGMDNITFYNRSVYWALTTLTTIGYGDITPSTNAGRVFTMFIMVTGVVFYGIVIGNVSQMILIANKHEEANKEKMNDLHLFMKHYSIPPSLQKQVYGFYQHILEKRLSDNDTKIIGELPPALQQEMQVYMKMKLIQNVPIFAACNLACKKMISKHLTQSVHTPGDYMIRQGDMGNEMYIIGHGSVEVVVEGSVVATLDEGKYFGEVALLEETQRNADVRSNSYCDLYTLSKESFVEICEKYPELDHRFRDLYRDQMKNAA